VEVGLGSLVPFDGEGSDGKKVNVKFTSPHPRLRAMEATDLDIFEYWGKEVKDVPSIVNLLSGIEKTAVIATSRRVGSSRTMKPGLQRA
jgi:predicted SPOUT superfamily RNA methylase MTH1